MLKKSVIVLLNIAIAAYLVLAIIAFNQPAETATVCTAVDIDFTAGTADGFLNKQEVVRILQKSGIYPKARYMSEVSPRLIEETLQKNPFVEKAQCYKTQNGHIVVRLAQRMPVMRVKASLQADYYIDSEGNILPQSPYTCDMIVATGSISRDYARKELAPLAAIINGDDFWRDQVVQVNVLGDGSLELVPRVGSHIIRLGAPVAIEEKLQRVRLFYEYGLSSIGWNKYSCINVEFQNQIVCKKNSK